jgi:uncharacterized membrane protein
MGVDVATEVMINVAVDEVAAYAMDPTNDTAWIGGIKSVSIEGDGPVGQGTRVARVASFLGRRIEYVNEIVTFDPPSTLVMESVKAPFPMKVTYSFESPDPERTKVTVRVEGDASGFYKVSAPVMSPMVKRNIGKDVARLKEILE